MAQETYVSIFDSTEYKDYVAARDAELPEETEEEKRRRLEQERLAAIQAEQPVTPLQPQEAPIEETPVVEEEEVVDDSYVSVFDSPEYLEYAKNKQSTQGLEELGDDVAFARKVNYGMAQEPTAIGSAYRLIKSGIQAAVDPNESYKEARERIENARQERILEEFPEFRGKHEDAGVLVGRGTMALIDPITFLIPWTKIAKAGKIASISSGAGVAAVDLSLREEALYGKVSPETVFLGLGLGAVGATVGEVVMAYARRGVNEVVPVVTETGQKINKKVVIPKGAEAPKLTPKEIAAVERAEAATAKAAEESIESQGILYNRLREINDLQIAIKAEIKSINEGKPLTFFQIDAASKPQKTFKTSPKVRLNRQSKKLEAERLKLTKEITRITGEQVPENILDILSKGMVAGFKENVLTEGMTRALVQEAVRPLFGGVIGAGIGAQFTDENDTNTTMATMAAVGFIMGALQRKIQTTPYNLVPKRQWNKAGKELDVIYQKSVWLHLKSITAGSHVQDLMAYSAPVVNYAARMFKMQGGGVALGKTTKGLSVEEKALEQTALWRSELIDMVSETDTEVMILAGKIVNQRGLKNTVKNKNRFLKNEDIKNSRYAEAQILATKIDDYTLRFKEYAKSTGLDFTDEAKYGLTQMLDTTALKSLERSVVVDKLAKAFVIQSQNDIIRGTRKNALTYKEAKEIADNYLIASQTSRNNSIWAKEGDGWGFQGNSGQGNAGRAKDEDFILTAARHFNKERTLYDQEARAFASELFEQNPLLTLKQLTENTVPVAEFSRVFGARGEGIQALFQDIDDVMLIKANQYAKESGKPIYKNIDEAYMSLPGLKNQASHEKGKIKDSLEAYFKVYGAAQAPVTEAGKATVAVLQAALSTTRLTKVAIPSMGDWMQTLTNSGFGPAAKSALNQIKKTGKGAEVLSLRGGVKQIDGKDVTFMDKFLGNNRYDNIIERELQDVFSQGAGVAGNVQRRATDFTRKFFEVVQLGRITRIARGFAFDAGTHRVMDISRKLGKGKKVSNALQKEIDTLGLNVDNIMYLSKFKNVDDAFADATGKQYLTKAGIKSADRDAIVPSVGNRRLFSQSKNPYVKFLGSFMSWAQAKTSQTNAIVARMEQGDAALAMRVAAALPLYYSIMSAQIALSSNQSYKNERNEQEWWQKFGETLSFSGLNTAWVDKAVNSIKFSGYGTNVPEQLAPVLGFMDDFMQFIISPFTDRDTIKTGANLVPFGKDIYSGVEQLTEDDRTGLSLGGIVGEEFIQGPEVPFTQDNAADRINPITGLPYNFQRVQYNNGKIVDPRYEGAKALLRQTHKYAVDNEAYGDDGSGGKVSFHSGVIGKGPKEHYIVNGYNPTTKQFETDEEIFRRIEPLIKSGQLKPYEDPKIADTERAKMRNEILQETGDK
jgi:hypothetical protein